MSRVDRMQRELSDEITFERDVPVVGRRRVKEWARVIGTIRKLEAEEQEAVDKVREEKNDLQDRYIRLLEENELLRRKAQQFELIERMRKVGISDEAQSKLLGSPTQADVA